MIQPQIIQRKDNSILRASSRISKSMLYRYRCCSALTIPTPSRSSNCFQTMQNHTAQKYADIYALLLDTLPGGRDGKHRTPTSKWHQRIINTKDKDDTDSSDTSSEAPPPEKPPRETSRRGESSRRIMDHYKSLDV
jgi:hypothetical protein